MSTQVIVRPNELKKLANLNVRNIYTKLGIDIRRGKSRWQVKTGLSRRNWRPSNRGLFNHVDYAPYVRPPGNPIGQSLRDLETYVIKILPTYIEEEISGTT